MSAELFVLGKFNGVDIVMRRSDNFLDVTGIGIASGKKNREWWRFRDTAVGTRTIVELCRLNNATDSAFIHTGTGPQNHTFASLSISLAYATWVGVDVSSWLCGKLGSLLIVDTTKREAVSPVQPVTVTNDLLTLGVYDVLAETKHLNEQLTETNRLVTRLLAPSTDSTPVFPRKVLLNNIVPDTIRDPSKLPFEEQAAWNDEFINWQHARWGIDHETLRISAANIYSKYYDWHWVPNRKAFRTRFNNECIRDMFVYTRRISGQNTLLYRLCGDGKQPLWIAAFPSGASRSVDLEPLGIDGPGLPLADKRKRVQADTQAEEKLTEQARQVLAARSDTKATVPYAGNKKWNNDEDEDNVGPTADAVETRMRETREAAIRDDAAWQNKASTAPIV